MQIGGESAAAATQLDDLAASCRGENRGDLRRQRSTEQRCQFRRGDEIAGRSQLGGARRVVAEPGRIQRKLHVARKRYPATRLRDRLADVRGDAVAVGAGVWLGRRKVGHGGRGEDATPAMRRGSRYARLLRSLPGAGRAGQGRVDHRRRQACRRSDLSPAARKRREPDAPLSRVRRRGAAPAGGA